MVSGPAAANLQEYPFLPVRLNNEFLVFIVDRHRASSKTTVRTNSVGGGQDDGPPMT